MDIINDDNDIMEYNNDEEESENINMTTDKQSQNNDNTALMNHQQFDTFVKSTVTSFLTRYNLGKITVDVGNGYKGSVKVNKNGEIEANITFKEIL